MAGFDRILQAVAERAARSLGLPVIVCAVRRQKAGEFQTRFYVHGLSRGEVGATALDLLRSLVDEIPIDDPCPCCVARRAQYATAVAALEAQAGPPQAVH